MPPVSRALLVLVLVLGLAVSMKSAQGARLRRRSARLDLDPAVTLQIGRAASAIANTSLSPWTYRESRVESRLPRRIFHAVCLTSGCLSLRGGAEDAAMEAKPIYHQVLVLHKISKKRSGSRRRKRYGFRLGTEVISVGCTCVRPSVVPQPPHAGLF
ncbi:interleukin 17a/f3 [Pseudoliparis swirei]|uniref:interleukin 17a/f3 n=1 Tax=Pseudoliparis swirei TaxID=2059687 RepID=UPI0024BECAE8|nr:interleukin 17a/f3 [Pseudoliparis swirei]